jgi:hypothetical protein
MRFRQQFMEGAGRQAQRLALVSLAAIVLYLGRQSLGNAQAQEFVGGQVSDEITSCIPPHGSGAEDAGQTIGTDMQAPIVEDGPDTEHQPVPIGTEMSGDELQRIKRSDGAPRPQDEEVQHDPSP